MYTFLAIIIELGAVIGTGILTFSMAKNVWQQTKQALIQDVALKALESKTGINSSAVKSLVGEKPMASDPGTAVGGIAGAVLGGAAGVGLGSYINDLVMPKNAETHRVNNNNINLTVNNNLNGVSNPDELVEAIGPSIKQVVAESLTAANEEQRWSEESTHFFHNGGTSYNS